ncbi:hypothetical protein QAD02_010276 [Eretmocerus hayati]|uniref:Uncharacterized protein n=1 Tax=Eretmocerus hayati TaxID=131215 RepID=A0ACC2NCV7_9HYME|nr:hypothetical protein QAD02_010276 [Eretmocerus hayati]
MIMTLNQYLPAKLEAEITEAPTAEDYDFDQDETEEEQSHSGPDTEAINGASSVSENEENPRNPSSNVDPQDSQSDTNSEDQPSEPATTPKVTETTSVEPEDNSSDAPPKVTLNGIFQSMMAYMNMIMNQMRFMIPHRFGSLFNVPDAEDHPQIGTSKVVLILPEYD